MVNSRGFISYVPDNDRRFRDALTKVRADIRDLTIPLTLIAKDFYKSEGAIFQLKSPGQYPDLAPSTKKDRIRRGQPIYPILVRSGAMERSLTDPEDPNTVCRIENQDTLIIGTKVTSEQGFPYPAVHQYGSSRVPMRKVLFIGPESSFALDAQKGRLERWIKILEGFYAAKLSQIGVMTSHG